MQLNYVPFLLRHFLGNIFKSRMTDMKITIAALGQANMQQQRPRSLMAPMQFALTMRVYDECPGLLPCLFKNGYFGGTDRVLIQYQSFHSLIS